MELFARGLLLRNCGRFLHVASDFGSDYKTLPFLSSEMLYAGLSRERSRVPRQTLTAMNDYDFFNDFRVQEWPVWFIPAMLVDENGQVLPKSRRDTDTHLFNSLKEGEPGIQDDSRYPKFGSMETILPDRRFQTITISPIADFISQFEQGQVFWMGKKRTMFQIEVLTEIIATQSTEGDCTTPFLQVSLSNVTKFKALEILTGTQRYLVMRGNTESTEYWQFRFKTTSWLTQVAIPAFAIAEFLFAYERH